jgi:hypothetical protein
VDQPDGDIELAGHAAGVGPHEAVGGVGQPESVEELLGPGLGVTLAEALDARGEHEVLAPGGHRVAARFLRDEPDRPAYPVRGEQDVDAGDARPSRVGPGQGGEDLDGGGFAGTVGAE